MCSPASSWPTKRKFLRPRATTRRADSLRLFVRRDPSIVEEPCQLSPVVECVSDRSGHGTVGCVLIFALNEPGVQAVHRGARPRPPEVCVFVSPGDAGGFRVVLDHVDVANERIRCANSTPSGAVLAPALVAGAGPPSYRPRAPCAAARSRAGFPTPSPSCFARQTPRGPEYTFVGRRATPRCSKSSPMTRMVCALVFDALAGALPTTPRGKSAEGGVPDVLDAAASRPGHVLGRARDRAGDIRSRLRIWGRGPLVSLVVILMLVHQGCSAWDGLFGTDRSASVSEPGPNACSDPGGLCPALGDAPDGGVAETCPRSASLLASLAQARRQCSFDDECPYGAHCSTAVGVCKFDCLDSAQCQPGQICNCLGRCEAPKAATRRSATLTLSPTANLVPRPAAVNGTPDWTGGSSAGKPYRIVQVGLTASGSEPVREGDPALFPSVLSLTPDSNLQVDCQVLAADGVQVLRSTGLQPAGQPCSFTSSDWTYSDSGVAGQPRRAINQVVVKPVATSEAVQSWTIRAGAEGISGSPAVAFFRYQTATADVVSTAWQTLNGADLSQAAGLYSGYAELTTTAGVRIPVPVYGRVTGNRIYLVDPTRVLSVDGLFSTAKHVMWVDRATEKYRLALYPAVDQACGTAEAHPDGKVTLRSLRRNPTGGRIVGNIDAALRAVVDKHPCAFEKFLDADFAVSFDLTPDDSVPHCVSGKTCSGGRVCHDSGLCVSPDALTTQRPGSFDERVVSASTAEDSWLSRMPELPFNVLTNLSSSPFFAAVPRYWCASSYFGFDWSVRYGVSSTNKVRATVGPNGDLVCLDEQSYLGSRGPVPFAIRSELLQRDWVPKVTTAKLLETCWRELRSNPQTSLSATPTADAFHPSFATVFDRSSECVNVGHVYATLYAAVQSRYFARNDLIKSLDLSLASRLIQQWLDVHSFVGRQGLEQYRLAQATSAAIDSSGGGGAIPLTDLLDEQEHAFAVTLDVLALLPGDGDWDYRKNLVGARCTIDSDCKDPGFVCESPAAARLAWEAGRPRRCQSPGSGSCNVAESYCEAAERPCPDWAVKRHCVPSPDATALQPTTHGVAPNLIEAATAYLGVMNEHVRQVADETYGYEASIDLGRRGAAIKRAAGAIQLSLFIEQVAGRLVPSTPTFWLNRWEASRREFSASRKQLLATVRAMVGGENPLGVPENDVPLFFGDLTGNNARFFASSDYLLDAWASPAVASAGAALESAREAWTRARDSEIRAELAKADSDRRQELIRKEAGDFVLDRCGSARVDSRAVSAEEVLDVFAQRGITGANCYLKEGEGCENPKDLFASSEARQKFLATNFTAAAAETMFCRLDYAARNADKPIPFLEQDDWSCFLRPGAGSFCDDCAIGDGVCLDSCVNKCDRCAATDEGDDCRSQCSGYTRAYIDETVQKFRNTARTCTQYFMGVCDKRGFERFADLSVPDIAKAVLPLGVQDGVRESLLTLQRVVAHSQKVAVINTAIGERPSGRPGAGSTRWINPIFDRPLHVVERAPSSSRPPCRFDIQKFYGVGLEGGEKLEPLAQTRPALWANAVIHCAARGLFVEIPELQLPRGCYGGRLGVQVAGARDMLAEARSAIGEYAAAYGTYEGQIQACEKTEGLGQEIRAEFAAYRNRRLAIADDETEMLKTQGQFQGAASGVSSGIAGLVLAPWNAVVGGLFGGKSGRLREAALKADLDFQQFQITLQQEEKLDACRQRLFELHRSLSGVRWRMVAALERFDAHQQVAASEMEQVDLTIARAAARLKREQERPIGEPAFHFWFDERIEKYRRDFEWARRLTFLAMRAVEFEFQQSLPLRSRIVGAKTPSELDSVLLDLKREQASRSINRRRPEEASVVLSLRDDVLEIADRSDAPNGERAWPAYRRFQERLWAQSFAVRDENGKWLGQGIPFELKKGGVLGARCAERLWRVTATVQGDALSPLEPSTPLILMKRNTFSSGYCDGRGDGAEYQTVSLRPSNDLLKGDPGLRAEEVNSFSAALMYPWFNVRRRDFYSLKYQEGASEELAGRGLYGDYVLLFPREVLEKGFPLERVEDVLLRVDYLSVDNLAPLKN